MAASGDRRRREIDWHYWANLTHVTLFEACALSLGIDPHSFDRDNRYYELGPGANDRPGRGVSRITQINTMEELDKRRKMASQALSSPQHFSAPSAGMTPGKDVLLLEFVRWLQRVGRTPIADGLLQAVAVAPRLLAAIKPESITVTPINRLWIPIARGEGQKIRDANPKWSKQAIAQRLYEVLDTKGVRGRGGRLLSVETIRKEALKDM